MKRPKKPPRPHRPSTRASRAPSAERDRLAEVEQTDASVTTGLPGAERAAAEREMMSRLQRAATAAERLKELSPEAPDVEELEPSTERHEEPPSGPQLTAPLPPPFAITSNGQLLLNVDACPDLKLEGRTIFRGIALSDEEAAYARDKIEDTIHDAAGHLGGMLKRRDSEGSGGDDDT
jgi:hypothetical protein